MVRFQVAEKTPAEWAEFANSIPDAERRTEFIKVICESAYKSGYQAGMKHEAGAPMPWPAE